MPIRLLSFVVALTAALGLMSLAAAVAGAIPPPLPTVEFAAPLPPSNTRADNLTISATASEAGGHITKVVFSVQTFLAGPSVADVGDDKGTYSATIDISGLLDGTYLITAEAFDGIVDHTSSVTRNLIIDRTAPTLTLTQGPVEGEVVDPDVDFGWSASDPAPASPPLTVTCAWDAAAQGPCPPSALGPSDLVNGAHRFTIIASDALGNRTTLVRHFMVTGGSGGSSVPTVRCRVPKLKGLSLAKAKARIMAGGCTVGTVRRLANPRRRPVVVRTQSRRAGQRYVTRARINLVLGPKA